MRGLRTQEDDRFLQFANAVEEAAAKQNCVFFFDAGLGDDFSFEDMDCDNCVGWLIPNKDADLFEEFFNSGNISHEKWDDFYMLAEPTVLNGKLEIKFS